MRVMKEDDTFQVLTAEDEREALRVALDRLGMTWAELEAEAEAGCGCCFEKEGAFLVWFTFAPLAGKPRPSYLPPKVAIVRGS